MNLLTSSVPFDAETVRDLLRQVVDPEVGVNIVDLGLVTGLISPRSGC